MILKHIKMNNINLLTFGFDRDMVSMKLPNSCIWFKTKRLEVKSELKYEFQNIVFNCIGMRTGVHMFCFQLGKLVSCTERSVRTLPFWGWRWAVYFQQLCHWGSTCQISPLAAVSLQETSCPMKNISLILKIHLIFIYSGLNRMCRKSGNTNIKAIIKLQEVEKTDWERCQNKYGEKK